MKERLIEAEALKNYCRSRRNRNTADLRSQTLKTFALQLVEDFCKDVDRSLLKRFRAQLVRDLEENYPEMEVSWMNFSDCPDCERNRLAKYSPKLENENGDTISRQAAIDVVEEMQAPIMRTT